MSQILFLDDNEDLREALSDIIEFHLHETCLSFASLDELKAQKEKVLKCRLAILDINLGAHAPSGIDAYNWLVEQGFKGHINFLTGHARSHPLVIEASEKGAGIWSKPFDTKELCRSIAEILKETRESQLPNDL